MTGVTQSNIYLAEFPDFVRKENHPGWLRQIQESAMERFSEVGFPTTHDEEWRFTNVAPIVRQPFQRFGGHNGRVQVPRQEGWQLVLVNGRYAPKLSTLPGSIKAGSLAEALRAEGDTIQRHLARYASFQNHSFVALNTAFIEDGVFVSIPRNNILERPLHIVSVSTGGSEAVVSHPRNLVLIGENSQATITESYIGSGDQVYFTNAVTEIVVGEGAVVDHYKLELEQAQAFHLATLQVQQGRSSNFSSHSISFGGALVRNDATAVLSEGCECTMNGLYLVNGKQHIDNHTTIDHAQPHANSHELYKGVLDGKSSAVFNGKILVRKDAQKTDSKQTNKNLILSEDAVINTKPELQIFADDVRCTHGATIGQLDADAIFYLRSRGIEEKEARQVLTLAFARDVIDRVKIAAMRENLERILFEKLNEHPH